MTTKVDFKKTLKHLYKPSQKEFSIVEVPEMHFLMIDGQGDPNTSQAYKDAVGALYAVAYKIKFLSKKEGFDYVVPPLEGLWWTPEMADFSTDEKGAWHWTMMIMQPESITPELFEAGREAADEAKDLPALPKLRFDSYAEGLAAQILYVGSYADEAPTIARLHDFIREQGYERTGKHHEIYLSNPERVAPEKLKTVIRQPMRRA